MEDPKASPSQPEAPTLVPTTSTILPAAGLPPAGEGVLSHGVVFAGRYEIQATLGQGGMGAVYRARDLELEREVALKVIRPELSRNPEILQRFKQELILARQITHRNIIRIFDLGESDGIRFITMECIEGRNLHDILVEKGKLGIDEGIGIMEQVAAGLAVAHREGVIHRDLKPGNIMCETNGRVVVMDFGLARTAAGDGMTQTGAMLGTLQYMSPEQAFGQELKASSDIYSLGLILYELLAGVLPFQAETAIAGLLMRTQQRPTPLIEVIKDLPVALSNIVAKCLEKDPAKRYQNAEELSADLRAWQDKSGKSRVSVSSWGLLLNRFQEVSWRSYALSGLMIVLVSAGAVWYLTHRRMADSTQAHSPVSVLVADFKNNTGDPLLEDTLEPMVALSLEGASFINAYSRGDARSLAKKLPNPTDKLDDQSARLVAVNQGVSAVISGEIHQSGGSYVVSASAIDAVSGKVLATSEVSVTDKHTIPEKLPSLAAPLRKALGDTTPPSVQFEEVSGGFKAASLDAMHADADGVEKQFAGKFQDAFLSFQKAAELDPRFARAYTGMAAMAQNLGRTADAIHYMQLAMEHVDRMTERERFRNRGLYYLTTGDWQRCVDEYSQLVAHYPADRVGQNNLANCYTQLRNAPKAVEAAQRAVTIVPRGVGQRLNLAFISAFAGDFAASDTEARTALSINPGAAQAYLVLAEAALGNNDVDKAAENYHKLEGYGGAAASTAQFGLADLAAFQGRYTDAVRILQQGAVADSAAGMSDNASRKYAELATIDNAAGKHSEVGALLAKALKGSPSPQVQFLAAVAYAESGDQVKAQKLGAALTAAITTESQAYGKIVAGLIALERKDRPEAIRQIAAANALLNTWIGHFYLGQAYLDAQAFTEADAEFEICTKRRGEAIELFMDNVPTYSYFPLVTYNEGRAREGMKSDGYADFYKSYLQIRGHSTEDALAADARRRVAQ